VNCGRTCSSLVARAYLAPLPNPRELIDWSGFLTNSAQGDQCNGPREEPGSAAMNKRRVTLLRLMLAALLIHCCAAQSTPLIPRPIAPIASRPIETPPFSFLGESQCDGDGNMYFQMSYSTAEIFELSRDGNNGTFLRPTGKFVDPSLYEFEDFWVSGDGKVWVLVGGTGHASAIQFEQNGTMKDPVTLEIPEDVLLSRFALFDNGFLFVAGAYRNQSAHHRQGQGYQAILNSSGQVTRELSILGPDVNFSAQTDGGVASARGNLYFLGSDRITVISPGGEILRKQPFCKPDLKSVATKIYVSGGMVVVKLLVETKGTSDLSERFLVLDEDTGEAKGYYQSSESYDVCMTRDQELIFLSVNQSKQKIVIARIW
jgi:hypothetical protein